MIILWLVAIYLLAKHIPLPKSLEKNVTFRFLISISLSLILLSVLALIFYFIHLPISPMISLTILLLCSILTAYKFPKNSLKPNRQDFLLVLPAMIVVLFFGVNIFLDGYGKHNVSQTAILQSISKAEDDAGNHLMLFSRFYMNDNSTLTFDSYTAGYEWSTSLLANSIVPSWLDPPAIFMVDFYVIFKLATLGVLILMFTLILYESYKKHISSMFKNKHHILLSSVSLAFGLFFFAPLYRNGFYSFMPILIFIMMIITLLLSISDTKSKKIALIYILTLTMGISTSWFIATPIALLVSFILICTFWKKKDFWPLVGMMFLNVAVLSLLLIMLFSAGTIESADQALLLSGGYPTLSRFFVISIIASTIGFLIINRPKIRKMTNLPSLYIEIAIIFIALIFAYFQFTSGSLTYYYLKIETSVIIAILPFSIIFIFSILKNHNFYWKFLVFPVFIISYMVSQLVSPNDYIQYITDWNNKAATLEVNAAVPIIKKLSMPIRNSDQNVCVIIINKALIQTINADHIANNTSNRIVENHCLPKDYVSMHNSGKLDFQVFVDLARHHGVKYELYISELGGGPIIINSFDNPNVEILDY
jgi:hypothetical protein